MWWWVFGIKLRIFLYLDNECLLTTHCVGIQIFKFHGFWTIQFPAPLVFVALNVKCVDDFLHVQSHMAEVPQKWKLALGHL